MKEFSLRKGWVAIVEEGPDGADITIKNPKAKDGLPVDAFYSVSTKGNPYGAPKVFEEPTFGISLRECGIDHDGLLVGAVVVMDDTGEKRSRFSWTNVILMQGKSVRVTHAGELFIAEQPVGFIHMVFESNKNRIVGFVGVCRPTPPTQPVRVCELEDLAVDAVLAMV